MLGDTIMNPLSILADEIQYIMDCFYCCVENKSKEIIVKDDNMRQFYSQQKKKLGKIQLLGSNIKIREDRRSLRRVVQDCSIGNGGQSRFHSTSQLPLGRHQFLQNKKQGNLQPNSLLLKLEKNINKTSEPIRFFSGKNIQLHNQQGAMKSLNYSTQHLPKNIFHQQNMIKTCESKRINKIQFKQNPTPVEGFHLLPDNKFQFKITFKNEQVKKQEPFQSIHLQNNQQDQLEERITRFKTEQNRSDSMQTKNAVNYLRPQQCQSPFIKNSPYHHSAKFSLEDIICTKTESIGDESCSEQFSEVLVATQNLLNNNSKVTNSSINFVNQSQNLTPVSMSESLVQNKKIQHRKSSSKYK